MPVTITTAGLVAVYPEWARMNTETPAVVAHAVAVANAKTFVGYTNTTEEEARRYLEACAILYDLPYARDMSKPDDGSMNPYRRRAQEQDQLKGSSQRAPGWTLPVGVS